MEIIQLIPGIYERLIEFMLIFIRISALFTTFIFFRREIVTQRVTLSLSIILSVYAILLTKPQHITFDLISTEMLATAFFQFFIGFISGLILNIVFEVFLIFGQIASTQIGLSMASIFDPKYGNISSLSNFYMIVTSLVFLSINGHLVIIKLIVDSFANLPIDVYFAPATLIKSILSYSNIMFVGSLMVSLTLIVTILFVNISLAAMSKFAPQLNVFSIGINISLIVGLICLFVTFNMFIQTESNLLNQALQFLHHMIVGMK